MDDIVPPLMLAERFERHLSEGQNLHTIALARGPGWDSVADALARNGAGEAAQLARKVAEAEGEEADPEWRAGDYIITVTGRKFWPMDPRPEDVDPEDIVHVLAAKGRFGCHSKRVYSVGAHSLRVGVMAGELARQRGLDVRLVTAYARLHDGNEAYLPDVPSPIKPFIPGWDLIEARVQNAIHRRFGLGVIPAEVDAVVRLADSYALGLESRALYHPEKMARPGKYPTDSRIADLGTVWGTGGAGLWFTKEEIKTRLLEGIRQVVPQWDWVEDTTEEPEASGTPSWLHEESKAAMETARADMRTQKWRDKLKED